MIGQNPKAEVALFSSVEIGIKNISFGMEVTVNGVSCQTPGEEAESSWTR